jgi:predicted GNAT family acetyltransferase
MDHPLDRPAWSALTSHQAGLARGDARALRFPVDVSPFGAAADDRPDSLAALGALLPDGGSLGLVEAVMPQPPAGVTLAQDSAVLQMLWPEHSGALDAPPLALGDDDAADMHALAILTRPGPFLARTHTMGRFLGIREGGRLAAMAGERLHCRGFTEISGVCTHPDFRGRGYAALLMRAVGAGIVARGEKPFLHVYPDNRTAIAMYERLGFRPRRELRYCVWTRD